ncbi:MAG: hypothetical protein JXA30_10685, partial [Deltaproteobacteria bacterium]|nr:hypothetical protein [Deltaproteobacteria bacterium]
TILAGTAGALGFTGELAADLFAPLNAYRLSSGLILAQRSLVIDSRYERARDCGMLEGWRNDLSQIARYCLFALLLAVLFDQSSVSPARAQCCSERLEKAKLLFVEGQREYLEGRLSKALGKFHAAHHLVPSAELAYNIGHISEQLGDAENAIRFLRLYLSRSLPSAKDQEQVEKRIALLQTKTKARRQRLIRRPATAAALTGSALSFFKRGVAMFRQGRYQAALVSFTIALKQAKLPEIYYNIAQASEQLGRARDAVDNYRAYLDKQTEPSDRELIEHRISELLARLSDQTLGPGQK